jgi:hypothetical protein
VLRSTRRDDETIVDTMRRHAPRVVGGLPARSDRERWVRALNAEATRPDHFPAHLDWEDYRPRWVDVMEFTRRLLAGRTRDRCRRSPITWGGPMDDWLAIRRGLVRVDCGDTRNRFWARPPN